MAYDAATSTVVLFGGIDKPGFSSVTPGPGVAEASAAGIRPAAVPSG